MERLAFALVLTQLARSRLGLPAAIGAHLAINAFLWIAFGAHSGVTAVHGSPPLVGSTAMLPAPMWPAFATVASLLAVGWIVRPAWWHREAWFTWRHRMQSVA